MHTDVLSIYRDRDTDVYVYEPTNRLAAHRAACEARFQQAVQALEAELAMLDKDMAKQEEEVDREVGAETAGVEEALAAVREEKAAVLRKLEQLQA